MDEVTIPTDLPKPGYYYHYKHDPNGPVNNYAYEVIGVGKHTENNNLWFVIYRPLYEAFVFKAGRFFDIRPLGMFMEHVEKGDAPRPRFQRIADSKIISELRVIARSMYPS